MGSEKLVYSIQRCLPWNNGYEHMEANPSEAAKAAHWRALGTIARQINGIASEGFGQFLRRPVAPPTFPNKPWPSVVKAKRLAMALSSPEMSGLFSPEQRQSVEARLGLLARDAPSSVLVHGNLMPQNALVSEDGTIAVIDWGDSGAGHPLTDVAEVCAWKGTASEEFRWFLEGYGVEFDSKTQEKVEALALIRLLVVARLFAAKSTPLSDEDRLGNLGYIRKSVDRLLAP